MTSIEVSTEEGVARVTINRPHRMNALDRDAAAELAAVWDALENDQTLRAVVLTGAGDRAFCAGADLKSASDPASTYWLRDEHGFGGLGLRPRLPVPIVARVNGAAVGGGLELVLGCDLAIATTEAVFGLPEPIHGRVPLGGGAIGLPRQVPRKLAMQLLLTGRPIDAAAAMRFGLINDVVPADRLDSVIDDLIGAIRQCGRSSLRAILAIVDRTEHLPLREARALRVPEVVTVFDEEDSVE